MKLVYAVKLISGRDDRIEGPKATLYVPRNTMIHCKILRLEKVLEVTGYSRSFVYKAVQDGVWTRPVKVGPRASGWPEHEVQLIMSARIAGATTDTIKEIVAHLMKKRVIDLSAFRSDSEASPSDVDAEPARKLSPKRRRSAAQSSDNPERQFSQKEVKSPREGTETTNDFEQQLELTYPDAASPE